MAEKPNITTGQFIDRIYEDPRRHLDLLVSLGVLKHNVVEYTVEGSDERFTTEGYQLNV